MKKYFISLVTSVVLLVGVFFSEAAIKNFVQTMTEGEAWTDVVYLESGKDYKFSASGCPRVNSIGLYIMDAKGTVLKEDNNSSTPSMCFTPDRSGNYRIKAVLESTVSGASSGKVKADIEEGCGSKTYYYYGPCR